MNPDLDDINNLSSQNDVISCQYYTFQEFITSFPIIRNDNSVNGTDNVSNNINNFQYTNRHIINDLKDNFSLLHINSRSINKNFDSIDTLLNSLNNFSFSVIGISETWLHTKSPNIFNIPNYHMIHDDRKRGRGGGVALYINSNFKYKIRKDICIEGTENIFIEIDNRFEKNIIIGILYRAPRENISNFLERIDEQLEKISRENKNIYLMGDFNIDLSHSIGINPSCTTTHVNKNKIDNNGDKFLNILSSYAFYPCINIPTRITPTSSTLIDNIFTNALHKNKNSGVFTYDVSDHLPIFLISSEVTFNNINKDGINKFRKENTQTILALNEDLANEEWVDIFREKDVNKAYANFMHKLTYYYDKNIPLVKSKQHNKKIKNPWITQGILRSIKTRNRLYKLYISKPSEHTLEKYKQYRNKLTNIIRMSKKTYYSQKIGNAEGDINATWKIINNLINKNKPQNKIDNLKVESQPENITDPTEIAHHFNSFFTNIGPDLASKINCRDKHFSQFLSEPKQNAMFLIPTNEHEILQMVKTLKSKRSSGYDGISTKLLKQIIPNIVAPLEYIFNLSLSTGCCPDLLKIAKVIPIYKKDDPHLLTNYRPISLLPAISKILEKLVYKRLSSFLTLNNILNPSQFGFRKKYSTDFAITKLLDKVTQSLSEKEHVIALFMDLSKAFDTIDHNILLYKLKRYGIRGFALSWFKSYLSNRQQFVSIGNVESSFLNIKCGVPQGSILGPLLFLIYINDIVNSSTILSFVLFADDTNIVLSHKNLNRLISTLNVELAKVSSWFKCNKLSLNISKTNFMHYQTAHTNIKLPCNIKIDNMPLVQKDNAKFLGITIDSHLTWNQHVTNISIAIAKGIGILYKVKNYLLEHSLLMIYNTLILPYLNYCNIVWGNCHKTKLNQIMLLQKKAVRICTNSTYLSHTNPLFHKLKVFKIHDINTLQIALFMFKYNKELLPPVFSNFFSYNKNIHSYPTRSRNDIHLNNPKNLLAHKSLRHHGPEIWNSLPVDIKSEILLNTFKKRVKGLLLNQYITT